MHRPSRLSLNKFIGVAALIVLTSTSASPVRGAAVPGCQDVSGKGVWTSIPSPNDPFGRTMGTTSGHLKSAATDVWISAAFNPIDWLVVTSSATWVLDAQDTLQFSGVFTFKPLPGEPVGTADDTGTLTVIGGTGIYAGATGALSVSGTGYNVFGSDAGPGNTFLDLRFSGTICKPR